MLQLEVAELTRDLQLTKRLLPSMPHLAEKILDTQKLLAMEKKVGHRVVGLNVTSASFTAVDCLIECCCSGHFDSRRLGTCVVHCVFVNEQKTEKLCAELETPENSDRCVLSRPVVTFGRPPPNSACCLACARRDGAPRWRALVGEDPDEDQLAAKIQLLEERLSFKKEQLLEKDLVLEEVTGLCEKLRAQATEGRSGTQSLATQLSSYQARIKETTRKMMAIVSELSMYQATSMKLQQEQQVGACRTNTVCVWLCVPACACASLTSCEVTALT
jgi:hypothetical protein